MAVEHNANGLPAITGRRPYDRAVTAVPLDPSTQAVSAGRGAGDPGDALSVAVLAALVRVSVGCEHVEDLWADLEQALAAPR